MFFLQLTINLYLNDACYESQNFLNIWLVFVIIFDGKWYDHKWHPFRSLSPENESLTNAAHCASASHGASTTGIPISLSRSLASSLCCFVTLTSRRLNFSIEAWSPVEYCSVWDCGMYFSSRGMMARDLRLFLHLLPAWLKSLWWLSNIPLKQLCIRTFLNASYPVHIAHYSGNFSAMSSFIPKSSSKDLKCQRRTPEWQIVVEKIIFEICIIFYNIRIFLGTYSIHTHFIHMTFNYIIISRHNQQLYHCCITPQQNYS